MPTKSETEMTAGRVFARMRYHLQDSWDTFPQDDIDRLKRASDEAAALCFRQIIENADILCDAKALTATLRDFQNVGDFLVRDAFVKAIDDVFYVSRKFIVH